MTPKMPDYEAKEQPQSEGDYYCSECRRETYHSHYSPQTNDFYEHASDEELAAVANEPDRLKCDQCQARIEREFTDG